MAIENYREMKILLAEAFVEGITTESIGGTRKDFDDLLLIKKLKLLEAVGLSHFWTAERLVNYGDPSGSTDSVSLTSLSNLLIDIALRFIGKIEMSGRDGLTYISDYMDRVIEEANVIDVSNSSVFTREFMFSRTAATPPLSSGEPRKAFIKANLWLGVLHMAIASGVCHEIIQKGK